MSLRGSCAPRTSSKWARGVHATGMMNLLPGRKRWHGCVRSIRCLPGCWAGWRRSRQAEAGPGQPDPHAHKHVEAGVHIADAPWMVLMEHDVIL